MKKKNHAPFHFIFPSMSGFSNLHFNAASLVSCNTVVLWKTGSNISKTINRPTFIE